MNKTCTFILSLVFVGLASCRPTPHHVIHSGMPAPIYPDYTDVTIPYNIAPLNFLMEGADALQVVVRGNQDSLVVHGKNQARFPLTEWKNFLQQHKGSTLTVSVTARHEGQWTGYDTFNWYVAPESIDAYLSYRLIEPGYEVWNNIQLCERHIENFEEKIIADNRLAGGNCMNCHTYGRQGQLSMFHLRGKQGGTILSQNGQIRKLTLKNDSMVSAAVYGDFHPTGKYAVFSSNIIIPAFHATGNKRLEVYDTQSDLAVADFENNRMLLSPLTHGDRALETFPTFSADGQWIYFCSAPQTALPDSVSQLRYSLCRIAFDARTGEWGQQVDTLWNARIRQGSVCFPKASPDGRYLLFSVADYGTFPIWHRETDLRLMDLSTGETNDLAEVNSDRSDTYHSWSSNSRWFVFASKRGDGQYGKPYFAYIDAEGHAHKPFVLPQKDPEHYFYTFKSYNIPELSATSAPVDALRIKEVYEKMPAETFK